MTESRTQLKAIVLDTIIGAQAAINAAITAQAGAGYAFIDAKYIWAKSETDHAPYMLLKFHRMNDADPQAAPRVVLHELASISGLEAELQGVIDLWESFDLSMDVIDVKFFLMRARNGDRMPTAMLVLGHSYTAPLVKTRSVDNSDVTVASVLFADGSTLNATQWDLTISFAITKLTAVLDGIEPDWTTHNGTDTDIVAYAESFSVGNKATVTIADVVYTARDLGAAGNNYRIIISEPASENATLSITHAVDGSDLNITISLAKTDGAITTTAQHIVDAFVDNAIVPVDAKRTLSVTTATGGTAQVAAASTALTLGTNPTATASTEPLADGDLLIVAPVIAVEPGGTSHLYFVYGRSHASTPVHPTEEEIVNVLQADGDWSGVAYVVDWITMSRSGATVTPAYSVGGTAAPWASRQLQLRGIRANASAV